MLRLRYLLAMLLLVSFALADASAQTTKPRVARKKIAPYSARGPRRAPNINPHTGKPYGAGVSQDVKDGTAYLAPGVPMRKQAGYQNNGGYNDNRTRRPATKKPTNSSLTRGEAAPTAPAAKSKSARN
ncbi:hypothetical protein [Hymenobacter sp.]|uniref:hypothetical protein n=1 Tax=Hymenobacter sp. TaxID=1898978 RepID=UPI00286C1EAD|nr:hypothetical protein [Hymenobacter sp.]